MLTVGLLSFGLGMLVVANAINGDDNHWDCNWHGGSVNYNNNVYVSRTNNIVRPGYRPGAPARPPYTGQYPRPATYPAARPSYGAAGPAIRPYNSARAGKYAANNPNLNLPGFPNPETLPNNTSKPNKLKRNSPEERAAKRPANGQATANRAAPRTNAAKETVRTPASDPLRGYTKDHNSNGGRTGALGGYEPGGFAQESSSRGRASLGGGNRRGGNQEGK